MNPQDIVDEIEDLRMIRRLPPDVRIKLLNAVYDSLMDNWAWQESEE